MDRSQYDRLLQQLHASDEKAVAEAVQALAGGGYAESVPSLIALIRTTESKAVRNAVAVALADLKDERAAPVLAELLQNQRYAGSRGSLLYALSGFDNAPFLEHLVDIVIGGNFEERHQAFQNIELIESELDTTIWDACIRKLEAALKEAPSDRQELIASLLDLFTESDDSAGP